MSFQKIIDDLSASMRETRKGYHLTLGELIKYLEQVDPVRHVYFDADGGVERSPDLESFHSYRGYYSDLAIDRQVNPVNVRDFLKAAYAVLGKTLTGYKGGDFHMGDDTPLWVSSYGSASGIAIIDIKSRDGMILLVTKQVDD